jgi:hypothetical protein
MILYMHMKDIPIFNGVLSTEGEMLNAYLLHY